MSGKIDGIDGDGAPARLAEQPQTTAYGDGQAGVEHDDSRLLGKEHLEPGENDVASVEREDRQQVEQADDRAGPPQGTSGIGGSDARMQRVDAHRQQGDDADRDLDAGPGEADACPLPSLQRAGGHERRVAGQEVERDLGARTGGPGGYGMAELVEQREDGDEPASQTPSGAPLTMTTTIMNR